MSKIKEQHLKAIVNEIAHNVDFDKAIGNNVKDAAQKCEQITKQEMEKFEFFIRTKFRIQYTNSMKDFDKIYIRNEDYGKKDIQRFSPLELIELYLS